MTYTVELPPDVEAKLARLIERNPRLQSLKAFLPQAISIGINVAARQLPLEDHLYVMSGRKEEPQPKQPKPPKAIGCACGT